MNYVPIHQIDKPSAMPSGSRLNCAMFRQHLYHPSDDDDNGSDAATQVMMCASLMNPGAIDKPVRSTSPADCPALLLST